MGASYAALAPKRDPACHPAAGKKVKATFYRLGEIKIIQSGGALWWEAHAGLGASQSGRCIIRGNILLLGPVEAEESGYLKREFLESLRGIPLWDLTAYYCSSYSIHDCRSGRRLELPDWADISLDPRNPTENLDTTITARLGQHEVSKKSDGQWWWRTCSGSDTLREGRCAVEGGILFLLASEKEDQGNLKDAFLEHLSRLPPWRATEYYCPSSVLYECRTGKNLIREGGPECDFIPPARVIASSATLPDPQQPSPTDSTLPLFKEAAAAAGRAVQRRLDEVILKHELRHKSGDSKSDKTASRFSFQQSPFKKWIFWGGGLLLAGLLSWVFLHDQWKSWDRHHKEHQHSAGRHGSR
jgi:hypothetical protein